MNENQTTTMEDQAKWVSDLNSSDVSVRATAAESLCAADAGSTRAAIALVKACADNESVQIWAVSALEGLGPPPIEAIEPLSNLAADDNALVAYWAATLLGRLGRQATTSQTALANVLTTSTDDSVRQRAAWALGKIGADTEDALNALAKAADSGSERLARLAQSALPQTS